jgi:hypothetical protein
MGARRESNSIRLSRLDAYGMSDGLHCSVGRSREPAPVVARARIYMASGVGLDTSARLMTNAAVASPGAARLLQLKPVGVGRYDHDSA